MPRAVFLPSLPTVSLVFRRYEQTCRWQPNVSGRPFVLCGSRMLLCIHAASHRRRRAAFQARFCAAGTGTYPKLGEFVEVFGLGVVWIRQRGALATPAAEKGRARGGGALRAEPPEGVFDKPERRKGSRLGAARPRLTTAAPRRHPRCLRPRANRAASKPSRRGGRAAGSGNSGRIRALQCAETRLARPWRAVRLNAEGVLRSGANPTAYRSCAKRQNRPTVDAARGAPNLAGGALRAGE